MEANTINTDAPVESSPTTFEAPSGDARTEWLKTGKLPEAKPKPKTEASASSSETAPDSETGKQGNQERKPKPSAADRLNEILADLKTAGLTPAELKTFKREAQNQTPGQQQRSAEAAKQQAATEQTAKPAESKELKAPEKPNPDHFKTYAEYEAAKDKYYEDLADYKSAKAVQDFRAEQAQNATNAHVHQKMVEARERYGEDAVGVIREASKIISGDAEIPPPIKMLLNNSPIWADLVYALGNTPEELAEFVHLAKTNPLEAMRKAVLVEHLTKEELAKGGGASKEGAPATERGATERGEDGKFQKRTPEDKESKSPPPAREVSGRGNPPADPAEKAFKDNDPRAYFRAQNAKDLAARRG